MHPPNPPLLEQSYTDTSLDKLGFHDCYVFGIRWDAEGHAIVIDLDYVAEWVSPDSEHDSYRFWVAKAELRFRNVDEVTLRLEWGNLPPICQIQDLHRRKARTTPNGRTQWLWELELSTPDGGMRLWSTDFELRIHGAPLLSDTQWVR